MSDQTPIEKAIEALKDAVDRIDNMVCAIDSGIHESELHDTAGDINDALAAIAAHVEAQRPSKVLTDEVIGKLNAPVNLGNYGDLTDKERSYLPLIGEAIHEAYRAGIRYARDNGYIAAVQPQTEPVAWMYQRASTGTWHFVKTGQRRIHNEPLTPLYLAPQALVSYAMSKDYEALYDHLCNGGEALGRYLAYEKGPRPALLLSPPLPYTEDGMGRMVGFGDLELDNPEVDMRAEFIAECTRLNLEWLAPVQPLSVDQIMEVVKWGNQNFGNSGADAFYGAIRERLNKLIG